MKMFNLTVLVNTNQIVTSDVVVEDYVCQIIYLIWDYSSSYSRHTYHLVGGSYLNFSFRLCVEM